MFRVKNNKRVLCFFVIFYFLASTFSVTPKNILINAEVVLPEISAPEFDGNLTSTQNEWADSAKFITTLNNEVTSIFVGTNNGNIHFGINFTQSQYVPLNTTAPVGATDFVAATNRTHDFFAIQIDRNFDQAIFGTSSSFDDLIVFNQYDVNKSRDGYVNGSIDSNPIQFDTNAGGSEDGRATVLVNEGVNDQVSYEFEKPVFSNDKKGGDFNLQSSRGIQFRLVAWFNKTANATYSESIGSQWFTLKMNATGTGFVNAKAANLTTVNLDVSGFTGNDSATISTLLEFTGYNIVSSNGDATFFTNYSTTYALFIGENGWTVTQAENLWRFISLGGKAIVVLSGANENAIEASQNIVSEVSLGFESNLLLSGITDQITIDESNFNSVPFLKSNSQITDEEANSLQVKSWALNVTNSGKGAYLLSQKYKLYDLVKLDGSIVYDSNGNNLREEDDLANTNISIAIGFDFQFGGRILLTSFNPLSSDSFSLADNVPFFYRSLSWATKETYALLGTNATLSNNNIIQNENITIKASVTDLFENSLATTAQISAELTRVGQYQASTNLTYDKDGTYEANFQVTTLGFQQIKITGFADWYGFYEFEPISIFAERDYLGFNLDKNVFLIIFGGIIPIILVVFGFLSLRRYVLAKE